jgi:hypothetical protein
MSTDMAITLAKKFIRQISQPFDHTQTGISLWALEDIEEKQRKDKEDLDRAMEGMPKEINPLDELPSGMRNMSGMTGDEDYGANGMDGEMDGGPRAQDAEMDLEYGELDEAALMDIPMDEL